MSRGIKHYKMKYLQTKAGPLLTLPPLLLFKNLLDDPYRIKRLC
jgi:hypothetical protein